MRFVVVAVLLAVSRLCVAFPPDEAFILAHASLPPSSFALHERDRSTMDPSRKAGKGLSEGARRLSGPLGGLCCRGRRAGLGRGRAHRRQLVHDASSARVPVIVVAVVLKVHVLVERRFGVLRGKHLETAGALLGVEVF